MGRDKVAAAELNVRRQRRSKPVVEEIDLLTKQVVKRTYFDKPGCYSKN